MQQSTGVARDATCSVLGKIVVRPIKAECMCAADCGDLAKKFSTPVVHNHLNT